MEGLDITCFDWFDYLCISGIGPFLLRLEALDAKVTRNIRFTLYTIHPGLVLSLNGATAVNGAFSPDSYHKQELAIYHIKSQMRVRFRYDTALRTIPFSLWCM